MTSGIEGDPGRAMAGSMAALSVTIACLNDEEWEEAASKTGIGPDEREGMQCLLEQLGGPGEMAEAMIAAGEGHFTALPRAGAKCGLDMGPLLGQAPARTPPAPTATVEAPTPVSTPVTTPSGTPAITGATPVSTPATTGATPTGTPATPTPSPTQVPSRATSTPAPEPTSAAPTATPATATQPSRQSQPRESDHIFWVAADLPAILNSQAIKELRSIIKENTVYDLYFVAASEQAARFYPGAVQVVGQYIEHDTPQESEDTEYLVHRGHWIAYYGELDEQTVLFDPRNPTETARETRGGYIIHTLKRRHQEGYSLAARGYGTFERGSDGNTEGSARHGP